MYADWIKKWLDWMYWWLPSMGDSSDEKTPESTASRPTSASPEPTPAPTAPVTETSGGAGPEAAAEQQAEAVKSGYDDLTAIKGVGPAMQNKLNGLGITSFEQLAHTDPQTLADQLNVRTIKADRIREWAAEAKRLASS